MAPARVRGCAAPVLLPAGRLPRQADASRRRNGPRKATYRRLITVRLRSKSCPARGSDVSWAGRRAVVAQVAASPSAGGCGVEDQVGRAGAVQVRAEGGSQVNIIFKGRHTDVLDRFRRHATAKLAKLGKLDSRATRIDVEVSTERNPRQSPRRERVELTVSSRGPAIRAEAAAEDRYAALDLAFTKLESRLRRAGDRRKCRHGGHAARRSDQQAASDAAAELPEDEREPAPGDVQAVPGGAEDAEGGTGGDGPSADDVVPIEMEGNGPLVVQ